MSKTLPPGVPVKNGKPDLPAGIRLRGKKLFVDKARTIEGQLYRFTATCDNYYDAVTKAADFVKKLDRIEKGDVEDVPSRNFDWTLDKALREIIKKPTPIGWANIASQDKVEGHIRQAERFFGTNRLLRSLVKKDMEDFAEHLMASGNSNATVNRKMTSLSKLLGFAEDQSLDERTQKKLYKKINFPPKLTEYSKERRIFRLDPEAGIDEEKEILSYFRRGGDVDGYDVTAFGLDTGLRNSEIWGLHRDDINFTQKYLEVRGVYVATIKRRKTKGGKPRVVPLTERAVEILKRRLMSHGDSPFPFDNSWIDRKWDRMKLDLKKLDNEPEYELFTFYCTRHTCCTRLLQRGVDPIRVQKWMGHKDLTTTLRYLHLIHKDLDEARDVLEQPSVVPKKDASALVSELVETLKEEGGQDAIKQLKTLLDQL